VSSDSDSELSSSMKDSEAVDMGTVRRRRPLLDEVSNDENDIDVEAMSGQIFKIIFMNFAHYFVHV
jgi:hypothetical protein